MGFPNSGAIEPAPLDTKQIQLVAAEIYPMRVAYIDAWLADSQESANLACAFALGFLAAAAATSIEPRSVDLRRSLDNTP
jgi:hypothetical protein